MKPGVTTSEFGVAAGTLAVVLGGAVSSEHQQLIAGILAGVYVLGRSIVKAAQLWNTPAPKPPAPPNTPGQQQP